MNRHIR
jgi:serine/threonine protein kinase